MSSPVVLLAGVDRAAFATGLGVRLRVAGVPVALPALVAFTRALEVSVPADVPSLYWLGRLTLVHQPDDLAKFDEVFHAVFRDAALVVDPHARRASSRGSPPESSGMWAPVRAPAGVQQEQSGEGLPWHTLPKVTASLAPDESEEGTRLPELLPSAVARFADTPLDALDEHQLALLGAWLEQAVRDWPTRRSRRLEVHHRGTRVALRSTIATSRRTGWEALVLRRSRAVQRPRPVTVLVDVSRSMQPYALAYLHLMRALARAGRAETFVFSTALTRLTPALRQRSVEAALAQAAEAASDWYGGTQLAGSLKALLDSRHGNDLRGGILVLASDGWDSDPLEELAAVMARAQRRAHRVVWLNPRAAAPDFAPLVGSMAAALPYCDEFLSAHTPHAMRDVIDAVVGSRR